jgi:hypothetical protein
MTLGSELTYPVREINLILRACAAAESLPPGDPRHHDFSKLRGGDVLTEIGAILQSRLESGTYHHRILCGHRGCGKSTELRALKAWADQTGFLTIWIEVDLYCPSLDSHGGETG